MKQFWLLWSVRYWLIFLKIPFWVYLGLLIWTYFHLDPEDRFAASIYFIYALLALVIPALIHIPLIGFGFAWKRMLWKPHKSGFDYYELAVLLFLTVFLWALSLGALIYIYSLLQQAIL